MKNKMVFILIKKYIVAIKRIDFVQFISLNLFHKSYLDSSCKRRGGGGGGIL
jgi:hypothetical protein